MNDMNQMKMDQPTKSVLVRRAALMIAVVLGATYLASWVARGFPAPTAFDEQSFAGSYSREFTGAGGKVTETLDVKADKTVVWTTNYPGKSPLTQSGIWNARGETLVVVLDKRDGEKMPADERVIFDRKGKNLKGREYDKNVHGNSGLVFHRSS